MIRSSAPCARPRVEPAVITDSRPGRPITSRQACCTSSAVSNPWKSHGTPPSSAHISAHARRSISRSRSRKPKATPRAPSSTKARAQRRQTPRGHPSPACAAPPRPARPTPAPPRRPPTARASSARPRGRRSAGAGRPRRPRPPAASRCVEYDDVELRALRGAVALVGGHNGHRDIPGSRDEGTSPGVARSREHRRRRPGERLGPGVSARQPRLVARAVGRGSRLRGGPGRPGRPGRPAGHQRPLAAVPGLRRAGAARALRAPRPGRAGPAWVCEHAGIAVAPIGEL